MRNLFLVVLSGASLVVSSGFLFVLSVSGLILFVILLEVETELETETEVSILSSPASVIHGYR